MRPILETRSFVRRSGSDRLLPQTGTHFELERDPVEPLRISVTAPVRYANVDVQLLDAVGELAVGGTVLLAGSMTGHRGLLEMVSLSGAGVAISLVPDVYHVYAVDDDLPWEAFEDPEFLSAHADEFAPVRIVASKNAPIVLTLRR